MTDLEELNRGIANIEWYCEDCGSRLVNPIMQGLGFHRLGGSPKYHGFFKCPNARWYRSGHPQIHIQYINCNLDAYQRGEHIKYMYLYELLEGKGWW